MPRSPEAKLMTAIFCPPEWFEDSDLYWTVEGQTLRQVIHDLLDEISWIEPDRPGFNKRVKRVIALRFGFEDGRSRTLEDVGKEFNVSKERIRQIEARALRMLRHPLRANKLKPFLKGDTYA